ncbi:uncharacterized protein [Nicotiana tomentosiformis]|uniref:uncharacterized protein n=1 Tax=Nicotiana tomentosiformis TaxID=4098 RepID=UPI00388C5FED
MGQISQALNTRHKGALPSDMVVNPKGGNNTGHAMMIITRNEEISRNDVQIHDDVWIDIDDIVEETREEVNPSRENIIDIPNPVVQKAKTPLKKAPPPYPQRLSKQNGENQFKKSIYVPLVEALEKKPDYAKFMKDLVTKERSMNFKTIKVTHQVSAIIYSMSPKFEDPGAFTIPCTIESVDFAKAFCDLGMSIDLTTYSVLKIMGIGKSRPTSMRLQIVDRTMKRPLGVNEDVLF